MWYYFIHIIWLIGSSKERIKMRKGLSVAKSKAKLLISQINEAVKDCRERKKLSISKEFDSEIDKWGEVSESNFYDGVFSWQTDGGNYLRYYYELPLIFYSLNI